MVARQAGGVAVVADEAIALFAEVPGDQNFVVSMTYAGANSTDVTDLIRIAGMAVVPGL